mmetsp:Transcript_26855/g.78168  ORF Transcript_26855/g.78168 Transcript_26855/m.78168 type:complete len:294 (+) Transcript_26855:969-1850(+)
MGRERLGKTRGGELEEGGEPEAGELEGQVAVKVLQLLEPELEDSVDVARALELCEGQCWIVVEGAGQGHKEDHAQLVPILFGGQGDCHGHARARCGARGPGHDEGPALDVDSDPVPGGDARYGEFHDGLHGLGHGEEALDGQSNDAGHGMVDSPRAVVHEGHEEVRGRHALPLVGAPPVGVDLFDHAEHNVQVRRAVGGGARQEGVGGAPNDVVQGWDHVRNVVVGPLVERVRDGRKDRHDVGGNYGGDEGHVDEDLQRRLEVFEELARLLEDHGQEVQEVWLHRGVDLRRSV